MSESTKSSLKKSKGLPNGTSDPPKSKGGLSSDSQKSKGPPGKSPRRSRSPSTKVDGSFVLSNINMTSLDKQYVLPEITKKQERDLLSKRDDVRHVTTSLAKLGISTLKKEPMQTIVFGDKFKINLFVNKNIENAGNLVFNVEEKQLRCTWCHQYPPPGARMLAVPYQYVPSCVSEYVYTPECINVVESINVDPTLDDKRKIDPKNAPKVNFFKRDIVSKDKALYDTSTSRITENEYFDCAYPVCSFNCMVSKAKEISLKDPRFRNADMLIYFLYEKIFGSFPVDKINPASSYLILQEYGGTYTVEEFRQAFKFLKIDECDQFFVSRILNSTNQLFVHTENITV